MDDTRVECGEGTIWNEEVFVAFGSIWFIVANTWGIFNALYVPRDIASRYLYCD